MSLFGCANDEQFLNEIGPNFPEWVHGDIKKIDINDLRQVWNGRECRTYNEYLKELELHDKQRRKHFSVL